MSAESVSVVLAIVAALQAIALALIAAAGARRRGQERAVVDERESEARETDRVEPPSPSS